MIAGNMAVDEVAPSHLQSAGLGVDKRGDVVAWVDAMDVAVGETDFSTALDAGQPNTVRGPHAAEQSAGGELQRGVVGRFHDDVTIDLRVHKTCTAVALHLYHMHGAIAAIHAATGDLRVTAALVRWRIAGSGDELKSGFVINAKAVSQMLPVGATDDEGFALLASKLCRCTSGTPKRPEVNVLDAAHIEAMVDEQSAI